MMDWLILFNSVNVGLAALPFTKLLILLDLLFVYLFCLGRLMSEKMSTWLVRNDSVSIGLFTGVVVPLLIRSFFIALRYFWSESIEGLKLLRWFGLFWLSIVRLKLFDRFLALTLLEVSAYSGSTWIESLRIWAFSIFSLIFWTLTLNIFLLSSALPNSCIITSLISWWIFWITSSF